VGVAQVRVRHHHNDHSNRCSLHFSLFHPIHDASLSSPPSSPPFAFPHLSTSRSPEPFIQFLAFVNCMGCFSTSTSASISTPHHRYCHRSSCDMTCTCKSSAWLNVFSVGDSFLASRSHFIFIRCRLRIHSSQLIGQCNGVAEPFGPSLKGEGLPILFYLFRPVSNVRGTKTTMFE